MNEVFVHHDAVFDLKFDKKTYFCLAEKSRLFQFGYAHNILLIKKDFIDRETKMKSQLTEVIQR